MKKLVFTISLLTGFIPLFAQTSDAEKEVRLLEQLEVKAVLAKDSITLLKLWDKEFLVNAPNNTINAGGATTLDRPVLRQQRASFTRETELVRIYENLAIAMGSETVTPIDASSGNQAQVVKRRYTNIWQKKGGEWKLIARHANVICNP